MKSHFNLLKARQRQERDSYPENLSLRVHRALSWLQRASTEEDADSYLVWNAYPKHLMGRCKFSAGGRIKPYSLFIFVLVLEL